MFGIVAEDVGDGFDPEGAFVVEDRGSLVAGGFLEALGDLGTAAVVVSVEGDGFVACVLGVFEEGFFVRDVERGVVVGVGVVYGEDDGRHVLACTELGFGGGTGCPGYGVDSTGEGGDVPSVCGVLGGLREVGANVGDPVGEAVDAEKAPEGEAHIDEGSVFLEGAALGVDAGIAPGALEGGHGLGMDLAKRPTVLEGPDEVEGVGERGDGVDASFGEGGREGLDGLGDAWVLCELGVVVDLPGEVFGDLGLRDADEVGDAFLGEAFLGKGFGED